MGFMITLTTILSVLTHILEFVLSPLDQPSQGHVSPYNAHSPYKLQLSQ